MNEIANSYQVMILFIVTQKSKAKNSYPWAPPHNSGNQGFIQSFQRCLFLVCDKIITLYIIKYVYSTRVRSKTIDGDDDGREDAGWDVTKDTAVSPR